MGGGRSRSWTVIVAVFVGIGLTVGTVFMLTRLGDGEPAKPTNVATHPSAQTVKVLHATKTILAGTTAEGAMAAGALELRDTPKAEVQLGAVGSIISLDNGVALEPIEAGTQITVVQFGCTQAKWVRRACTGQ